MLPETEPLIDNLNSRPSEVVDRRHDSHFRNVNFVRRRPLPARRQFSMNPITKFARYGRFPFKLALNVALFGTLCAIIMGCDLSNNSNEEEQRQTLIKAFMPSGYQNPAVTYMKYPTQVLDSGHALIQAVATSTKAYYTLVSGSPAHYKYYFKKGFNDSILPPQMIVMLRSRSGRLSVSDGEHIIRHIPLTLERPAGIFADLDQRLSFSNATEESRIRALCFPRRDSAGKLFSPCTIRQGQQIAPQLNGRVEIVRSFTIEFKLVSTTYDRMTNRPSDYSWSVNQVYDMKTNGLVKLTVSVTSILLRQATGVTTFMAITIAALLIALWDSVLRFKALFKIKNAKRRREALLVRRERRLAILAKRRHRDLVLNPRGSSTESTDGSGTTTTTVLSSSSGMESHSTHCSSHQRRRERERGRASSTWKTDLRSSMGQGWVIWAICTDAIAIIFLSLKLIGTTRILQEPSWLRYFSSVLGGLSLMGSCSIFASYVRFFPSLYALFICTDVAAPHLGRFLVAVLPIFAGFSFFGMVAFQAYCPEFDTFQESATSLYAAIFGDSLLQAFQVVGATDNMALKWIGRTYCFTFISLFIYAVFNIATSIVMGSFEHVRERLHLFRTEQQNRATMRKSRREQLESAIAKAEEALFEMAALMTDQPQPPGVGNDEQTQRYEDEDEEEVDGDLHQSDDLSDGLSNESDDETDSSAGPGGRRHVQRTIRGQVSRHHQRAHQSASDSSSSGQGSGSTPRLPRFMPRTSTESPASPDLRHRTLRPGASPTSQFGMGPSGPRSSSGPLHTVHHRSPRSAGRSLRDVANGLLRLAGYSRTTRHQQSRTSRQLRSPSAHREAPPRITVDSDSIVTGPPGGSTATGVPQSNMGFPHRRTTRSVSPHTGVGDSADGAEGPRSLGRTMAGGAGFLEEFLASDSFRVREQFRRAAILAADSTDAALSAAGGSMPTGGSWPRGPAINSSFGMIDGLLAAPQAAALPLLDVAAPQEVSRPASVHSAASRRSRRSRHPSRRGSRAPTDANVDQWVVDNVML